MLRTVLSWGAGLVGIVLLVMFVGWIYGQWQGSDTTTTRTATTECPAGYTCTPTGADTTTRTDDRRTATIATAEDLMAAWKEGFNALPERNESGFRLRRVDPKATGRFGCELGDVVVRGNEVFGCGPRRTK